MSPINVSVIIPVHGKWDLTRSCLKSIAKNTDKEGLEIIVVDNASEDATPRAAQFLGTQLFGGNFRYIRNNENRNFAGASNQGALAASGGFLLFLNNDTEVQPGWLDPLLNDFTEHPGIAATGPLLVYPETGPLGRLVQHLGVFISAKLGHLYQGIPASSPLAAKRRFFQAITAACMLVPKNLFMTVGQFDEGFINGYEDVDLCARLGRLGYGMTINPASIVMHLESQTPCRRAGEDGNMARFAHRTCPLLRGDWAAHARDDGLALTVGRGLEFAIRQTPERDAELEPLLALPDDALREHVMANPYWEKGWRQLIGREKDATGKAGLFRIFLRLAPLWSNALEGLRLANEAGDAALASLAKGICGPLHCQPEEFRNRALAYLSFPPARHLLDMEREVRQWLDNYPSFVSDYYAQIKAAAGRMPV